VTNPQIYRNTMSFELYFVAMENKNSGFSQLKGFFVPLLGVMLVISGGLFLTRHLFEESLHESHDHSSHSGLHENGKAPDLKLFPLRGASLSSEKILRENKILLINFWASWCTPCLTEMPSLQKLWDRYGDKGLEMALVNIEENPEETIPRTNKRLKLRLPMYFDKNQALSKIFDVSALPHTVVLGRDGVVLFQERGERDWDQPDVHDQVENWLADPSTP